MQSLKKTVANSEDRQRMMGAGVLLAATAVMIISLIIALGSTAYPLRPDEFYVNRVFDGYNCTVKNSTYARCQQCVIYNLTENTVNCTTCDVTFAVPHLWDNCTSNIYNASDSIPIASTSAQSASTTSTASTGSTITVNPAAPVVATVLPTPLPSPNQPQPQPVASPNVVVVAPSPIQTDTVLVE